MSLPPNRNLFKEYRNNVMVETGSYRGDAIAVAMEAGYKEIRSIDIDKKNTLFCMNRFNLFNKPDPRISLYTGDSAKVLHEMIGDIVEPITFWLDAHSQYLEDEEEMANPFPLLQELRVISEHPVKTHTILIDDLLILTHPDVTGWTRLDIFSALKEINPHYTIEYIANPVINNLLIAHL